MKPSEIKAIREKLGKTRTEFARQMGCNYQSVVNWEEGTAQPSRKYLQELTRLAGILDTPQEKIDVRWIRESLPRKVVGRTPTGEPILSPEWTQERFAKVFGVTRETVARWEIGTAIPEKKQTEKLRKISDWIRQRQRETFGREFR